VPPPHLARLEAEDVAARLINVGDPPVQVDQADDVGRRLDQRTVKPIGPFASFDVDFHPDESLPAFTGHTTHRPVC
jgi:hypothetical protein